MRTAAEEARTLVAQVGTGTLATLSEDGSPWASFVAYAALGDGTPVLLVSSYAEHGRNLAADPRASLSVAEAPIGGDELDRGRVTVAGRVERTDDLAAFTAAHRSAEVYAGFADFAGYVLRVERVRWVGGYGRMDSVTAADYAAAEPDPVAGSAASAVAHMNADHADALLLMAQRLGGFPDAERAECVRADRYGFDLRVDGEACRVAFAAPVTEPGGLRAAAVELTRRARTA